MKHIKTLIWIVSILILLIIITIIIISNINKDKKTEKMNIIPTNNKSEQEIDTKTYDDEGDWYEEEYPEKAYVLTSKNTFFSIEELIQTYLTYLKAGNNEAVYSILDNTYITTNGINNENVLNIAKQGILYDGNYKAKKIYIKESENSSIYYVYGTLEKSSTRVKIYFIVYTDPTNLSYSLKPITEQEYLRYTIQGQVENYAEKIERTDYNKLSYIQLNNEQIAQKYFENYKNDARYYPQDAYNSLDERYKNLRFGSYENFTAYLTQKAAELEALDYKAVKNANQFQSQEEYQNYIKNLDRKRMEKYYIYTVDETDYCICVDGYGNYYIFKIIDVMNYKLILDTYTIDLPDFLEKYKDASIEDKVILNIEKIFEALNNKDYNYVYNKLEPTYRENTVGTYENFATIMSKNLYEKNSIEYETFTKGENSHKYTLTITDATGKNQAKIQMNITMMLGENTDYTIKFE